MSVGLGQANVADPDPLGWRDRPAPAFEIKFRLFEQLPVAWWGGIPLRAGRPNE
jgi:hypothetical protein